MLTAQGKCGNGEGNGGGPDTSVADDATFVCDPSERQAAGEGEGKGKALLHDHPRRLKPAATRGETTRGEASNTWRDKSRPYEGKGVR